MFATVHFEPSKMAAVLSVPSEAIITTGQRSVVILAEEGDRFKPVEVMTGMESHGITEITHGLEDGQRVVVSGQFLIDSEANLKATANRMSEQPQAPVESGDHK
jgi:Cu(I)/Ag(I) efflux system membrane fusion protein